MFRCECQYANVEKMKNMGVLRTKRRSSSNQSVRPALRPYLRPKRMQNAYRPNDAHPARFAASPLQERRPRGEGLSPFVES